MEWGAEDRERRAFGDSVVRPGASGTPESRAEPQGSDSPRPPEETLTRTHMFDRGRHGRRDTNPENPGRDQDDRGRRLLERSSQGRAPGPEVHADERLPHHPREPDCDGDPRGESVSIARRRAGSLRRRRHLPSVGGRTADRGPSDQDARESHLDATWNSERWRREEMPGSGQERYSRAWHDAGTYADIRHAT